MKHCSEPFTDESARRRLLATVAMVEESRPPLSSAPVVTRVALRGCNCEFDRYHTQSRATLDITSKGGIREPNTGARQLRQPRQPGDCRQEPGLCASTASGPGRPWTDDSSVRQTPQRRVHWAPAANGQSRQVTSTRSGVDLPHAHHKPIVSVGPVNATSLLVAGSQITAATSQLDDRRLAGPISGCPNRQDLHDESCIL